MTTSLDGASNVTAPVAVTKRGVVGAAAHAAASAPSGAWTQDADELSAAELMFRFLGFALSFEPDERLLSIVREPGFLEDAPFASDAPSVRRGMGLVRDWADSTQGASDDATLADLRSVWLRALVGVGRPLAPPWQSVYTDKDHLMFAHSTLEVRRFYRLFGFEPQKLNNEPDDHIGLMMSFLALTAAKESDASGEELERVREGQREFIERFIAPSVNDWVHDVVKKVPSDFYAGAALLVKGSVERRLEQLGGTWPQTKRERP